MVTELRQFINAFRTPVRIVDIDAHGTPRYCAFNVAALLDAGLEHGDIAGRTALEIYPGVLGEIAHTRHLTVARTASPLTFDMDEETETGRAWMRVTLAPAIDQSGNVERIFCTQIDITAEKQLHAVQDSAETRVREMEDYLAMAAHDLRSPMTNIGMIAKYIRQDFKDLSDGKLDLVELLETIAEQTKSLISDVLAHALTNIDTDMRNETFELKELCGNILGILDPFKQSKLHCANVTLAANKLTVQIAIQNLVDNALKHNKGNALEVRITVSQKNQDFLEFLVFDNGAGFQEPALVFIESGKMSSKSGFGLIGVTRLVRRFGGDIRVASTSNSSGATIAFTLPGTLIERPVETLTDTV